MKLLFVKNITLRIVLMSIVGLSIFSFSVMSLAKKNKDEMASVKEVGNTSGSYVGNKETLELINRLNTTIADIKKIRWEN